MDFLRSFPPASVDFFFLSCKKKRKMSRLVEKAFDFIDRYKRKRRFTAVHHNYAMDLFQRELELTLTVQEKICLEPLFHMYLYMPVDSPIRQFYSFALREESSPEFIRTRLKEIIDDYAKKATNPWIEKDLKVLQMICGIIQKKNPKIRCVKMVVQAMMDFLGRKHNPPQIPTDSRKKQGNYINEGAYGVVYRHQSGLIDKFYRPDPEEDKMEKALLLQTIIDEQIDPYRNYLKSPMIQVDYIQHRISFRDEGISLDQLMQGFIPEDVALQVFRHWDDIMHALLLLQKAGYTHRDIKSGNVMFSPTTGRLGLIDFDIMMRFKDMEEKEEILLQHVYFAWPLETYYNIASMGRKIPQHRFYLYQQEDFISKDFDGFFSLCDKYFKYWYIFYTERNQTEFIDMLQQISNDPDQTFDIEPFRSNSIFANAYFEIYGDRYKRQAIRYDPSKIDTFSTGILMLNLFIIDRDIHQALMKKYGPYLIDALVNIIFWMVHPDPQQRWDGEQAYAQWILFKKSWERL